MNELSGTKKLSVKIIKLSGKKETWKIHKTFRKNTLRYLKTYLAPPRLSKTVGRSWWRHKVREGHLSKTNNNSTFSNTNSCGGNSVADTWDRQRSVISALTLAAISMQEQQKEDKVVINEGNKEEKEVKIKKILNLNKFKKKD